MTVELSDLLAVVLSVAMIGSGIYAVASTRKEAKERLRRFDLIISDLEAINERLDKLNSRDS